MSTTWDGEPPESEREPREHEDLGDVLRTVPRRVWSRWPYRVGLALSALLTVVVVGGFAVWLTDIKRYSLAESLYFALYTVTTVGYGELPDFRHHVWARVAAAVLMVLGLIVVSIFQSTLTALFVEGVFTRAVRRRRMLKAISELRDHFILIGCGRVGRYVAEELHRMKHPFVIIERSPDAVHHLEAEVRDRVLFIEGNAAEDEVLHLAGIERAKGLATTLSQDRDNLFVTLTARTMNPNLRIIAKVVNATNDAKFLRAGASGTVSPQSIGGRRLATDLTSPQASAFFENMMSVPRGVGFHELFVNHGCFLAGKTLREARLRDHYDLLVVGVLSAGDEYQYNPESNAEIKPGEHLIVLGKPDDAQRLRLDIAGSL